MDSICLVVDSTFPGHVVDSTMPSECTWTQGGNFRHSLGVHSCYVISGALGLKEETTDTPWGSTRVWPDRVRELTCYWIWCYVSCCEYVLRLFYDIDSDRLSKCLYSHVGFHNVIYERFWK